MGVMNWYKIATIKYFRVRTPDGVFIARCMNSDCNLDSRFPEILSVQEISREDAIHHERHGADGGAIHSILAGRMSGMPQVKGREFQRFLSNIGFEFVRQTGSHQIWKNKATGHSVTVPIHNDGKVIDPRILRLVLRGMEMSVPQFNKAYNEKNPSAYMKQLRQEQQNPVNPAQSPRNPNNPFISDRTAQKINNAQKQEKGVGYKLVPFDGKRAYSAYNPSITIETSTGSVTEMSGNGLYLGTNPQFCIDHYSGLTDDRDILLTYEYDTNDILQGNPEEDGEIAVRRARLVKHELV